jgi:soluble lytic murein transglycosylase-like protein
MRHSKLFLALLLVFASAGGHADIYGYVDEQGVSHFSAEKSDARYQLLVLGNQFGSLDLDYARPGKQQAPSRLIQHPNLKTYEPLLKRASTDYAVGLALLKAVMAAESGFDPDAVSPKGAIGLMQVMPMTAQRYGLLGDKNKSLEQKLRDPKTNIRLGARYRADLFKLYPRQPSLVLASYNAGEGAVQRYNNKIPPYPETRDYVQLVTQLYHVYRSGTGAKNYKVEALNAPANDSKRMHLTIQPPRE